MGYRCYEEMRRQISMQKKKKNWDKMQKKNSDGNSKAKRRKKQIETEPTAYIRVSRNER